MEKKLTNSEICKLIMDFEKYILDNVYNEGNVYNIIKHFPLFLQENERFTRNMSRGLLSFGAFATFYIAFRLAMRTIRAQRHAPNG